MDFLDFAMQRNGRSGREKDLLTAKITGAIFFRIFDMFYEETMQLRSYFSGQYEMCSPGSKKSRH
jgi:hypothetical protein